ncbi:MAG: thiamine-phosphate kinase [Planctomycetota bacterium]|nr:MAG: thiamine-phosphate kinase [Planctomycetota bacterium]
MKPYPKNLKLSQIGEDKLLQWLAHFFGETFQSRFHQILLGPGDDAAILQMLGSSKKLVITTDTLVENVHFRREWMDMEKVGKRAMAQNLSDLAAMGAKPLGCVISLVCSPEMTFGDFWDFAKGLKAYSLLYQTPLVGGNLSRGNLTMICGTFLGEPLKDRLIERKKDKIGDGIFVTGTLGESRAALLAQINGIKEIPKSLLERYSHPSPRLWESHKLLPFVHTMMDISDGLQKDLPRLLHHGAQIKLENLPVSPELKLFCKTMDWDPYEIAWIGGEDFELLFTAPTPLPENFQKSFFQEFKLPITQIGWVTQGGFEVPSFKEEKGFEHFQ